MTTAPRLHHDVQLIRGAAAIALREIPRRSVDLAYCDPPFGNAQEWIGPAGRFSDQWSPTAASRAGWRALHRIAPAAAPIFAACRLTERDRAYLGVIAGILVELRRVMKLSAALWLHFDDTMGAYLRLLGQLVFGLSAEVGTLIWRRAHNHANANRFGRVHDTIACFARSPCCGLWGVRFDDFAETGPLAQNAKERVGYPTQKPVALVEELIRATTLPGQVVLDPTMGSGTALVAAVNLGRRAIGIDRSADAIAVAKRRLLTSGVCRVRVIPIKKKER